MEAKIHWNKQFSYDTFVALKCPSRSRESNCWRSHPMFSIAKHFFQLWANGCLQHLFSLVDCQLHFYWTQHPSRCLLWRKGLLKTILVSEDEIKFLVLTNKRPATEMLIGIVCISFSVTWGSYLNLSEIICFCCRLIQHPFLRFLLLILTVSLPDSSFSNPLM